MEKTSKTPGPNVEGGLLAAGALLTPKREMSKVLKLIREKGWLRKGTNATPCNLKENHLAVHLNPKGATAIHNEINSPEQPNIPPTLLELFQAGIVDWIPGLRVASNCCKDNKRPSRLNDTLSVDGKPPKHMRIDGTPGACTGEPEPEPKFRFIELFAGIGGFRLGMEALGGRAVFVSELDVESRQTYINNCKPGSPMPMMVGDITEVDEAEIPQHDMLTGGFCCQPFSRMGERQGFEDDRGVLFYEITRVLRTCRPKLLLLENVANILEHDGGHTLKTILRHLDQAGYNVEYRVVNSSLLLPQHRQRVYFVGFRKDLHQEWARFRFPKLPVLARHLWEVLQPEDEVVDRHLSDHQWHKIQTHRIFQESPGRRLARRGGVARTLTSNYRTGYYMYSEFVPPPDQDLLPFSDYQPCFPTTPPPKPSDPSEPNVRDVDPTPTNGELSNTAESEKSAEFGDYVHKKPRFYSPRECARIMGFPEDFSLQMKFNDNRIYHQMGNAVCPPIVCAIGAAMLRALSGPMDQSPEEIRVQDLGPALSLVLAACPNPDRPVSNNFTSSAVSTSQPANNAATNATTTTSSTSIKPSVSNPAESESPFPGSCHHPSLSDRVGSFLASDGQEGIEVYHGFSLSLDLWRNADRAQEEVDTLLPLLESSSSAAQMQALHAVCRLLHEHNTRDNGDQDTVLIRQSILEKQNLLPCVVRCLSKTGDINEGEIQRLAIVSLINLCYHKEMIPLVKSFDLVQQLRDIGKTCKWSQLGEKVDRLLGILEA